MVANHMDAIVQMYPELPFHKVLGFEILKTVPDMARVHLPFKSDLVSSGNAYHGGVIASLMDLTGALAAWSGHDPQKGTRAATVSFTVQYLAAARGEDIIAEARATGRAKELIFCDVSVRTKETDRLIAIGNLVYRTG
ncbi:MAG: PaaI family thioesterase [Chrysiogenetes bacterium]|nr:PaaI family thioesterase [Chrysiogenetes bacterium]